MSTSSPVTRTSVPRPSSQADGTRSGRRTVLTRMSLVPGVSKVLRSWSTPREQVQPPAGRGHDERTLRVLATVEAPAQARHFLRDLLALWSVTGELADDLELVVSELVSEAARYPLAVQVEVRLTRRPGRLELVVSDSCPQPPACSGERVGAGSLARAVLDSCSEHWDWSVSARLGRTVRAYVAC